MITGLPPCLVPMPGPLVETGSIEVRVCEVATPAAGAFFGGVGDGEGEGDGDGEADGEGTAITGSVGASGVGLGVVCVAAEVFRTCLLRA